MNTQTEFPEVEAAKDAAAGAVDRLIDLALDQDPFLARAAGDALGLLGFRASDAIMAAYPRAETSSQRGDLILVMAGVTPPWNFAAQDFLGQVARDETDEFVRRQAEDVRWYLMREHELEEVSW